MMYKGGIVIIKILILLVMYYFVWELSIDWFIINMIKN